jgi:hypothetical protein
MKDITHKFLLILVIITILGELASIVLWIVNPPLGIEPNARFSLSVDYIFAIANAAVMIPLNIIALYGISKRYKWGPLFLISISIGNRLLSQFLFVGGIHLIFVTWTVLLVIFAYAEYTSLKVSETAFLSVGTLVDFISSSLLFDPVDSVVFGFIFYIVFLVVLVGILIAIKKLR